MNCEVIDSILDDHRAARLSASERKDADTHLRACERCAEAWAVHHLLASERFAAPPLGLYERLASRLGGVENPSTPARRVHRGGWLSPALAAGVLLAAVLVWWQLPGSQRDAETVSTPATAPTSRAQVAPVDAGPQAVPTFTAGIDYELVGPGSLPATSQGRVQVVEFFGYWCFACYAFESHLAPWGETVEQRIELVRIPVAWNQVAELYARAHYAAAALGRLDIVYGPFFEEIHRGGNALASAEALAELFARFGVDAVAFDSTFNSSAVDAQVERAAALAREYGVTATPSLVIGGRYRTNPTLAGSWERMLAIAEWSAGRNEPVPCAEPQSRLASCPTR